MSAWLRPGEHPVLGDSILRPGPKENPSSGRSLSGNSVLRPGNPVLRPGSRSGAPSRPRPGPKKFRPQDGISARGKSSSVPTSAWAEKSRPGPKKFRPEVGVFPRRKIELRPGFGLGRKSVPGRNSRPEVGIYTGTQKPYEYKCFLHRGFPVLELFVFPMEIE